MPYIYADLTAQQLYNDPRLLRQLTADSSSADPDSPATLQETVLMAMENAAARQFDNHIRDIYPASGVLPLATITDDVKEIVSKLTLVKCFERKGKVPEEIADIRDQYLKRIKDVCKPDAEEKLGPRAPAVIPFRSTAGRPRSDYEGSGYFDGLGLNGVRDFRQKGEG